MIPRVLLWCLLIAALVRYAVEHWEVLRVPIPDALHWPHLALTLPGGGLAPWVLLGASSLGGIGTARRFPRESKPVAWCLGAMAVLVVPAHVLGLAGLVSGWAVLTPWAWALGSSAAAAWLLRRNPPRSEGIGEADVAVEGLDALLPWVALAALLACALVAHSVLRTVRIGPRCWDGESYHLPVPLGWLGTHSLTAVLVRTLAAGKEVPWHFAHPGNIHLLMCIPLLLRWDTLAYLVQLPFLLLSAWSCYTLARACSASRGAAALSALAFLSAPIVAEQASEPMLDLAAAALSLVALALLFEAAEAEAVEKGRLVLAGLAAGLALGAKTTALAHLGLIGVVVVTSRWAFKPTLREAFARAGPFVAALLVPSAFWYLRSAALLGNPFYPIRLAVGEHVLVGGVSAEEMSGGWERYWLGIKSPWEWGAAPFKDPLFFSEAGFGALLAALGALGFAYGGVALLRGARAGRLRPPARLALLAAVGVLIFFLAAARTPRFNLPLFAIFAALGGVAVDALGEGWRRQLAGLLCAAAVALTLALTIHLDGWDLAPPDSRLERLQRDLPAVPPALDELPPLVLFNDTHDDDGARPANYWLFGADHRHLVFEAPSLSADDPGTFLERLRRLGANAIFLRLRKGDPDPERYRTEALVPVARFVGNDYRSVIYRIR